MAYTGNAADDVAGIYSPLLADLDRELAALREAWRVESAAAERTYLEDLKRLGDALCAFVEHGSRSSGWRAVTSSPLFCWNTGIGADLADFRLFRVSVRHPAYANFIVVDWPLAHRS